MGLLTENDGPETRDALTPILDRMLREVRLVLSQYEQRTGTEIEKVILSGGGSTLKDIDSYVSGFFEKSIARARPFEKVEYPAFLQDTLTAVGPSFSVAVGAALRLLNEQRK